MDYLLDEAVHVKRDIDSVGRLTLFTLPCQRHHGRLKGRYSHFLLLMRDAGGVPQAARSQAAVPCSLCLTYVLSFFVQGWLLQHLRL